MESGEQDSTIRIQRASKTLRELTLEKMREAILNFHFQSGARLIERDLCAQLGVSRTIVREVLRHLESEGLVTIVPNRGPIVAQTSPEEAWQIYEIRSALEAMAAKACAGRDDPQIAAGLQAAMDAIRKAYDDGDSAAVLAATTEFYRTLFHCAGHDVAWSIVSALTLRINHLRSLTIKTKGRSSTGPQEMQAMVDAIRRGDAEGAAAAAQAHVANAASIARKLLEERSRA